jgi:ADP-ribosylglycohydrolase
MIGAIIGDIVGSRFEFNNHRSTDFELFHKDCSFTDDTICTVAVADWLMQDVKILNDFQLTKIMRRWCRKYPNPAGGYGGRFGRWIWEDTIGGYDSFGNGSAMRVSPVAWAYNHLNAVKKAAKTSAEISHDHPEGIKGAQSVADAIFMLRNGHDDKEYVVRLIFAIYGYKFPGSCEFIRDTNTFNETCQVTVPQAFQCFAESTDFESAIRLAVSIGGDTDTIAAIVGSLAEACYGVPPEIKERALAFLPGDMIKVINDFKKTFGYGKRL